MFRPQLSSHRLLKQLRDDQPESAPVARLMTNN